MCSGWCLSRNVCGSKICFGKHHSVNLRNSHPSLFSVLAKAVITRDPMAARLESIQVDEEPVLQGGHLKRGSKKLLTGVQNINGGWYVSLYSDSGEILEFLRGRAKDDNGKRSYGPYSETIQKMRVATAKRVDEVRSELGLKAVGWADELDTACQDAGGDDSDPHAEGGGPAQDEQGAGQGCAPQRRKQLHRNRFSAKELRLAGQIPKIVTVKMSVARAGESESMWEFKAVVPKHGRVQCASMEANLENFRWLFQIAGAGDTSRRVKPLTGRLGGRTGNASRHAGNKAYRAEARIPDDGQQAGGPWSPMRSRKRSYMGLSPAKAGRKGRSDGTAARVKTIYGSDAAVVQGMSPARLREHLRAKKTSASKTHLNQEPGEGDEEGEDEADAESGEPSREPSREPSEDCE